MTELHEAAQRLVDAATEYWSVAHRSGIQGAVIWLEDNSGKVVIVTRGEYRQTLMENIREITPRTLTFGSGSGSGEAEVATC